MTFSLVHLCHVLPCHLCTSLKQNGVFTLVITSGYTDSHTAHSTHSKLNSRNKSISNSNNKGNMQKDPEKTIAHERKEENKERRKVGKNEGWTQQRELVTRRRKYVKHTAHTHDTIHKHGSPDKHDEQEYEEKRQFTLMWFVFICVGLFLVLFCWLFRLLMLLCCASVFQVSVRGVSSALSRSRVRPFFSVATQHVFN